MPYCAAVDCSNSAKKGFAMLRFPKNPDRRRAWADAMERHAFYPTDSSRLCEVHFAADMWEKTRADGRRKLRFNAVPTLFSFTQNDPPVEVPCKTEPIDESEETGNDSTMSQPFIDEHTFPEENKSDIEIDIKPVVVTTPMYNSFTSTSSSQIVECSNQTSCAKELAFYRRLCNQQQQKLGIYQTTIKNLRNRIEALERTSVNVPESLQLVGIFTKVENFRTRKRPKPSKGIVWMD